MPKARSHDQIDDGSAASSSPAAGGKSAPDNVKRDRVSKGGRGEGGAESHRRFPSVSTGDPVKTRAFAVEVARLAADDKCEEVLLLDVRQLSQLTDYVVICSGSSDRQMHTVAQDTDELAAKSGYPVFRRNADDRTTWIVVDCVDVVVHIFEPNARAHYDLEMLWADAPRVEWERPDQVNRDRAGLNS